MQLYPFDDSYLQRLRAADPAVQQHFTNYFSELMLIKLRSRGLLPYVIDDIRQETFARVLDNLAGIREAVSLGSYVNSVCSNVLLEHYRTGARDTSLDDQPEMPDKAIDLEGTMVSRESKEAVQKILAKLSAKDRELLRAIFLEERDKDELCREMGINRDYLRVLLHRAIERFRRKYNDGNAFVAAAL